MESPLQSFLQAILIALPVLAYVTSPNFVLKTLFLWLLVYPCIAAWIISGSALKKFRARTPEKGPGETGSDGSSE